MSYNPKEDDFSGIYKITNTTNNRVYIGQSINVIERLKKHKMSLKGNYHENMYLQNSWNKYGENCFIFEPLEECEQNILLNRENYWMNHYGSYLRKNGYNIMKPSDNLEKFPQTEEHNKRISEGRQLYSDEEILSHLHEVYYMTGEIPNYKSINSGTNNNFHQIYARRFGSLKKAIIISGILTKEEEFNYTRTIIPLDELCEVFLSFIENNGRFPNLAEMITSNGLYGQSVIFKHFKNIVEFREHLGFTLEHQKELERKKELIAIREIYEEEGIITITLIDEKKKTRNSSSLIKEYGSSKSLYKHAGIDVKENSRRIGLKRQKNLKQYHNKSS